jgi:hypothetical protein
MKPNQVYISPRQATLMMKRARRLHREGHLTHAQFSLFDTMLWSCRVPGRNSCVVSMSRLERLGHMARGTVNTAIQAFERLGLLRKFKQRVRVFWNGILASRRSTSIYEFLVPPTESNEPPAYSVRESFLAANREREGVVDNFDPDSAFEKALSKLIAARSERQEC